MSSAEHWCEGDSDPHERVQSDILIAEFFGKPSKDLANLTFMADLMASGACGVIKSGDTVNYSYGGETKPYRVIGEPQVNDDGTLTVELALP